MIVFDCVDVDLLMTVLICWWLCWDYVVDVLMCWRVDVLMFWCVDVLKTGLMAVLMKCNFPRMRSRLTSHPRTLIAHITWHNLWNLYLFPRYAVCRCLDGADTAMALRCIPASNSAMDISHEFVPAHDYQSETAYQSSRYLDCDMYYKDPQLNVNSYCVDFLKEHHHQHINTVINKSTHQQWHINTSTHWHINTSARINASTPSTPSHQDKTHQHRVINTTTHQLINTSTQCLNTSYNTSKHQRTNPSTQQHINTHHHINASLISILQHINKRAAFFLGYTHSCQCLTLTRGKLRFRVNKWKRMLFCEFYEFCVKVFTSQKHAHQMSPTAKLKWVPMIAFRWGSFQVSTKVLLCFVVIFGLLGSSSIASKQYSAWTTGLYWFWFWFGWVFLFSPSFCFSWLRFVAIREILIEREECVCGCTNRTNRLAVVGRCT